MSSGRIIKVKCQCGQVWFKYYKAGHGRLIKCFLERIEEDSFGISELPINARPVCPACGKDMGRVKIIRGKPALKLNQGSVKPTRT